MPKTKTAKKTDAKISCTKTMKTEATDAKKAQAIMTEGGHRLSGVWERNKADKMVARAQGLDARAQAASAAATLPNIKVGKGGSQQVRANNRSVLTG